MLLPGEIPIQKTGFWVMRGYRCLRIHLLKRYILYIWRCTARLLQLRVTGERSGTVSHGHPRWDPEMTLPVSSTSFFVSL